MAAWSESERHESRITGWSDATGEHYNVAAGDPLPSDSDLYSAQYLRVELHDDEGGIKYVTVDPRDVEWGDDYTFDDWLDDYPELGGYDEEYV